jgi:hypothetical protein
MFDVASVQTGTIVSIATSNDENHPASNIIDGYVIYLQNKKYFKNLLFKKKQK